MMVGDGDGEQRFVKLRTRLYYIIFIISSRESPDYHKCKAALFVSIPYTYFLLTRVLFQDDQGILDEQSC